MCWRSERDNSGIPSFQMTFHVCYPQTRKNLGIIGIVIKTREFSLPTTYEEFTGFLNNNILRKQIAKEAKNIIDGNGTALIANIILTNIINKA